ncbi:tape measure protein [Deinococcus alpinitundrae]|uniref:tape measure protein n=1 Tax=Deinococcus alpinitundrae TaxID=468913 RepID=UPI001379F3AE|nr:tape measure protein [Deinococcus alpinitundrae]
MASNADQILLQIQAQVAGGADVKALSGLVNQLASDLRASGTATDAQRTQLIAARASLQALAGGYAAGSAEARKLTQAAASLTAQIGRIDSGNIRALAGYLAGVDTNAAGAKTRLEGIVTAAQAAATKFAAGSVEAQRLAQIIADAQRSINLINGRGIEDLEKKLKGAGTAGAQSRTQLEAVRAAALLMAQGFAAGSAEAQRLAAIIAGADAGLKRLTDAEKSTGLAAQIAARALAMLRGEADSSAGGFSRLQASLVSVNAGFSLLQQITQGVQRIIGSGLGLVRLAGDMEQAQTAFTTMLGSGQKAQAFLADLADFAARTPFELVGLRDSSRRLLAYGFQAKDIIPVLTAVGNAVGALGGGKDMLDGVTLAIGQIFAKGKVMAQEMNQLAERGIPAWKLLADKIGVSIPEAMKMAENGAISASTAIPAILDGLQTRFAGGMAAQSKTLLGLWSNTMDVLKLAGGDVGQFLIDKLGLKDLLVAVNGNLGKIRAAFAGGGLDKSFDSIVLKINQTVLPVFNQVRGAIINAWSAISSTYQTVLVPVFERIAPLVQRVWTEVPGVIQGAARFIEGAFNLIAELWEHVLRPVWDALAPVLGTAVTAIFRILGGWLDRFGSTFQAISQLISGDYQGAANTFSEMWARTGKSIDDALEKVWSALKTLGQNAFNKAKQIGLNIRDGIVAGVADLAVKLGESVSGAIEKVKGYIPDWARDLLHIGKGNFVDGTVARAQGVAAAAREDRDVRNGPTYGPSQSDTARTNVPDETGKFGRAFIEGLVTTGKVSGNPKIAAWCADVAAKIQSELGNNLKYSASAGQLRKNAVAANYLEIKDPKDARPGDLVFYRDPKVYGAVLNAKTGQRTGNHVETVAGWENKRLELVGANDSTQGRRIQFYDPGHATILRAPTSPFAADAASVPRQAAPVSKAKPENYDYTGVGGKAPVASLQDTLNARLKQAEDTFTLNTKGLEKSSAGYQKAVDRYLATLNNVQKLAFDSAMKLPEASASRSDLAGIVKSTADKITSLSKSGGALEALKKQIDDAKGVFSLYTKETPGYDKALDAYLAVLRKAAAETKKLGDGLPAGEKKSAFGALFTSTNSEITSLAKKDGLADQLKRQLEDARALFQRVSEDSPTYEKAVQTYIASLQKAQAAASKGISGTKDRTQVNALSDLVASTRSEVEGLKAAGTNAEKIAEIVRQKSEASAQGEADTAKQSLATAQRSYELALKAAGDSATAKLAVQNKEGAALEAAQEAQAQKGYNLARVQANNTLAAALQAAAKGRPALREAAEQLAQQQHTLALQTAQDARDNALSSARDTQAALLSEDEKGQRAQSEAQLKLSKELQASLRGVKKEALTQQLSDAVTQRDADLKNAEGNLTEQLRIEQASGAKILAYQRQLAEVQRNEASRALDEKARLQKLSNATTYAGNSTGLAAANAAVDSSTATGKTNLQTAYLASLDGFGRVAAQRLKDVSVKIQAQENQVADQLFKDRADQIKTISDTVNGLFSGGGSIEQQAAGRSDALGLLAGALRGLLGVTTDQASMGELSDVPTLLTKLAAAGVDLSQVDFDSLGQLGDLFRNLTLNSDQFLPVDQAKQFAAALRDLGGAAADLQLGLGDKTLSPTILSAYTALNNGDQASLQAVNSELAKIDPEKYPSLEALGLKVRAAIIKGAQEGVGLTIDGQKGVVQQQLTQLDQNKDGLSAENYLSRRKDLLEQSEALDYAAEQQRLDAAGASFQAYENAEVAHLRRLRGLQDDYNAGVLKADVDAARAHQQALDDLELQALELRHSKLEISEEDYINQRAARQLQLAQQTKESAISDAGGLYGDPAKVQAAQDAFNASQLRITGEQQTALGQLTLSRAKQTQDTLASLEAASLAQRKAARLITEEQASREAERLQIDAINREEKRAKDAANKADDVDAFNDAGRVAEAARIQATSQGEAERQNIVLQRQQATEEALSKLEQAGADQRHALKLTDDLTYSQEKEDIQLASIERQHQAALTAAGVDVDLQNAADRDAEAQRIALTAQGEAERTQILLQRRAATEDALAALELAGIERRHTLAQSDDLQYSQEKETAQVAAIEREHQRALTAAKGDVDLQNAADREAEAKSLQVTTQGEEERRQIRLRQAQSAEDALSKVQEAAINRDHALRLSTDLELSQQRETLQLASIERQHQAALLAAGANVDLQNAADREAEAASIAATSQGSAEREQIRIQRQQSTEDALAKLEEAAADRRHTLGLSGDLEYSKEKENLQLAAIERQHQRALLAAGVDIDLQNAADREAEAQGIAVTTQGEEERRVIRLNLRRAAEDAVTALSTAQEEARYKAGAVSEQDRLTASLTARRLAAQLAYGRALADAKDNADKIKTAELTLQTTLTQIDSDGAEAQISIADKAAAAKVKAAQRKVNQSNGYDFSANRELQGALTEQISNYRAELVGLDRDSDKYLTTLEALEGAEDALRAAREAQINTFAQYAQQAVPMVTAAMQALGGTSEEVAGQWGSDLSGMVNDVANFAKAISKGDYVGAAIQALTSIFTFFSRQAEAFRAELKKTTDYGKNFRFDPNGYGTRQSEQYTTGILFWKTTHFKETIDEPGKALALSLEGGIVSGVESGFKAALASGSKDSFTKSVYDGLKEVAFKGLVDGFLNSAPVIAVFGPLVQKLMEAFKSGNKDTIGAALEDFKTGVASLQPAIDGLMEAGKVIDDALTTPAEKARKELEMARGLATQQISIEQASLDIRKNARLISDEDAAREQLALAKRTNAAALEEALSKEGLTQEQILLLRNEYRLKDVAAETEAENTLRAIRQKNVTDRLNNEQTALELAKRAGLADDVYQSKKRDLALQQVAAEQAAALANQALTDEERAILLQQFALRRQGIEQDYLDWQTSANRRAAEIERGIRLQALSNLDSLADAEHSLALAAADTDDQRRQIDAAYNADKLARTLERIALEREAALSAAELTAAQVASINAQFDTQERVARLTAQAADLQAVRDLAKATADAAEQTRVSWRQSLLSGVQAILSGDSPLDAMYKGVRDRISQAIQDGFIVKRILSQLDPLFTQLDAALSKGLDAGGLIQQIGAALPGLSVQLGSELGPLLGLLNSAIPSLTTAVNNNTAAVKEVQFTQTTIVQSGQRGGYDSGLRARFSRFTA